MSRRSGRAKLSMVALIVLALGDFGRRDRARLGPVDTLTEILDEVLDAREFAHGELHVHADWVGYGSSYLDAAFDFARSDDNNDEHNVLLCAGKGLGAHALANVLFRFESYRVPMVYAGLGFMSIDATWKQREPDDRLRLPWGWVDVGVNLRRSGADGGARLAPEDFLPDAYMNEQSVVAEDPELDADSTRHHRMFEQVHRALVTTALADVVARLGF